MKTRHTKRRRIINRRHTNRRHLKNRRHTNRIHLKNRRPTKKRHHRKHKTLDSNIFSSFNELNKHKEQNYHVFSVKNNNN